MLYTLQYTALYMYFQSGTFYAYVCMHIEEAVISGTSFCVYMYVTERTLLIYRMRILEFTTL